MITRKNLIFLFPVLFFWLLMYYGGKYQDKVTANSYRIFNEKDIKGIISYVGIKDRGKSFKIENCDTLFVFYPYVSSINGYSFSEVVNIGDTMIKRKFSDTVYISSKSSAHEFTFIEIQSEE